MGGSQPGVRRMSASGRRFACSYMSSRAHVFFLEIRRGTYVQACSSCLIAFCERPHLDCRLPYLRNPAQLGRARRVMETKRPYSGNPFIGPELGRLLPSFRMLTFQSLCALSQSLPHARGTAYWGKGASDSRKGVVTR